MPAIGPHSYLMLAAVLFAIGLAGILLRRNVLTMLMCLQLMLSAVALSVVAHGRVLGDVDGQVLALIVFAVGAGQLALGLALAIAMHRARSAIETDSFDSLREEV